MKVAKARALRIQNHLPELEAGALSHQKILLHLIAIQARKLLEVNNASAQPDLRLKIQGLQAQVAYLKKYSKAGKEARQRPAAKHR